MKNILFLAYLALALGASSFVYAQEETSGKTSFSVTNWLSKNPTDAVSVQNGSGTPIIISITVNRGGSGVNISNCGTTTHIDSGSSTICSTSDSDHPVTMSSQSGTIPATGTYQVSYGTGTH